MGKIPKWVTGEFFGTFLLVFFGRGRVSAALLTGAQVGGGIYRALFKRAYETDSPNTQN